MAGEARLECRGAPEALPWQKKGGRGPRSPRAAAPLRRQKKRRP